MKEKMCLSNFALLKSGLLAVIFASGLVGAGSAVASSTGTVSELIDQINVSKYRMDLAILTGNENFESESGSVSIKNRFFRSEISYVREFLKGKISSLGYEPTVEEFEILDAPGKRDPKGVNIYFDIPGTEFPEEIVLLGAHYDTRGNIPGANDNGSGVATVLSIARAIEESGFKPSRTIRIAFFDAEEIGPFYLGSKAFFEKVVLRGDDIKLFVNVDMVSHSPSGLPYATLDVGRSKYGVYESLKPFVKEVNKSMKLGIELDDWEHYYSDQESGLKSGFPTLSLFEDPRDEHGEEVEYDPRNHKKSDNLEAVNVEYATHLTRLIGAVTAKASLTQKTWELPISRELRAKAYKKALENRGESTPKKSVCKWLLGL